MENKSGNFRIQQSIFTLTLVLLLGGCASIPAPLNGDFPAIEPQQAKQLKPRQSVLWGGVLIAIRNQADATCMEVLGKPLGKNRRPLNKDGSIGRFVACKGQFIDPEVFKEGREVTITGSLNRLEERQIGDYPYNYPIIDASTIYLWPERDEYVYYYTGGFYYWPYYNPRFHHPGLLPH